MLSKLEVVIERPIIILRNRRFILILFQIAQQVCKFVRDNDGKFFTAHHLSKDLKPIAIKLAIKLLTLFDT